MYTLQKLLTHKSPMMTQRTAHLRDDTLNRAADLAGSLIEETLRRPGTKGKKEELQDTYNKGS